MIVTQPSIPGCCQRVSRKRGKRRHVSKNTVTPSRITGDRNTVLVKKRAKPLVASHEEKKEEKLAAMQKEEQRAKSMQKGKSIFGKVKDFFRRKSS